MATGMETLLSAVLKSAGVDIEEFKNMGIAMIGEAQGELRNVALALRSIDQRLMRLELALLEKERDYPSESWAIDFMESHAGAWEQTRKDILNGTQPRIEKDTDENNGDGSSLRNGERIGGNFPQ